MQSISVGPGDGSNPTGHVQGRRITFKVFLDSPLSPQGPSACMCICAELSCEYT